VKTSSSILFRFTFGVVLLAIRLAAQSDFDRGITAYSVGRFQESVGLFERALTNGRPSVGVLYNLGNARFRNGEVGKAIAAWRLAERAAPGRGEIQRNLELARRQVGSGSGPDWTPWVRRLPPRRWAVPAAVAAWSWAILLLIGLGRDDRAGRFRKWMNRLGAVTILLLLGYSVSMAAVRSAPDAVVVGTGVAARFGPVDESPVAFPLPDGAEVRVDEVRGPWIRIVDSFGHVGWLSDGQVIQIPQ
jgi:tetratricopeptide (TPR) repeat protein